jgi:hypothetical protein
MHGDYLHFGGESHSEHKEVTDVTADVQEGDAPEGKRSISALRLAMITYFFTSGGPTGCEPAVGAAGNPLSFSST